MTSSVVHQLKYGVCDAPFEKKKTKKEGAMWN